MAQGRSLDTEKQKLGLTIDEDERERRLANDQAINEIQRTISKNALDNRKFDNREINQITDTITGIMEKTARTEEQNAQLSDDISQGEKKKTADSKVAAEQALSSFSIAAQQSGNVGERGLGGKMTPDPGFQNLLNSDAQQGFGTGPLSKQDMLDRGLNPANFGPGGPGGSADIEDLATKTRTRHETPMTPNRDLNTILSIIQRARGGKGIGGTKVEAIETIDIPSPYEVEIARQNLDIGARDIALKDVQMTLVNEELDLARKTKNANIAKTKADAITAENVAIQSRIQTAEQASAMYQKSQLARMGYGAKSQAEPIQITRDRLTNNRTKLAAGVPEELRAGLIADIQRDHIAANEGQSFLFYDVDKGVFTDTLEETVIDASRIIGWLNAMEDPSLTTEQQEQAKIALAEETGLIYDFGSNNFRVNPEDPMNDMSASKLEAFVQGHQFHMDDFNEKELASGLRPGALTQGIPGVVTPISFTELMRTPPKASKLKKAPLTPNEEEIRAIGRSGLEQTKKIAEFVADPATGPNALSQRFADEIVKSILELSRRTRKKK